MSRAENYHVQETQQKLKSEKFDNCCSMKSSRSRNQIEKDKKEQARKPRLR